MDKGGLRVAFLIGGDDASTRRTIEAVCQLAGIAPVGLLLDTGTEPKRRRLAHLPQHFARNGWSYPLVRCLGAVEAATTRAVRRAAISRMQVSAVLQAAFPGECFSLAELGEKYGMPVHAAGNLNGEEAIRLLRACDADLGIVLGTRILRREMFSVPRMGCVNLHKGKVPEYRGMPPGFWEIYDGVSSAGVTVHFVSEGLDRGDVVASGTVMIAAMETPDTLVEKLHEEGARVMAAAVAQIRDGTFDRRPQDSLSTKARTRPTHREVQRLRRRLPHWRQDPAALTICRNLCVLTVYYSGLYALAKRFHRWRGRSRGAILLYHRVNDYSKDVLTVDRETFAAQILAVSRRYPIASTSAIVDAVRSGAALPPTTIGVHFDDYYRDVLTGGAPILRALGAPACAFLNSGFIDAPRTFPHDADQYPFAFPVLRRDDVRGWAAAGFEVGAHTVNHVDLGQCGEDGCRGEIAPCGAALEEITGQPVRLFSFPFGGVNNINARSRSEIIDCGYVALFAAHGGFIGPGTDRYDIPRMGVSYRSAPVYCLLEIEGLAPAHLAGAALRLVRGFGKERTPTAAAGGRGASSHGDLRPV